MKTLFDNYIEVDMDTCKYQKDGFEYTAIVKEVGNDYLMVKPLSRTNFKDIYENNFDTTFQVENLHETSFDDIKLEIWMDGRGCDNSAIGVMGWYEPYTLLSA
jgi:hypothetical protein|tara:strand:+ start:1015 stop:1323 length:309 start_codon:yes stop_codon:yes gene_type:complete